MKISKEIKVALLVLSGIILFVFGFNYLKGNNLLSSSRTYYILYDHVGGLTTSTPVTINGMQVGKVTDIAFKGDGSGKLLTKIVVTNDFKFSKNSRAELSGAGLMGGKAIVIIPAFDGAENAPDGSFLQGTIKAGLTELVNQRLTPLQEKLEAVTLQTSKFFENLNDVFNEQTKNNLQSSIAQLSLALNSIKTTSNSLNKLLQSNQQNIDSVLINSKELTKNLSSISKELDEAKLGETIKTLDSTFVQLDSLLAGMNRGEGTLGKLTKDEALYNNLEGATKELEELLRDFKLHPKRYTRILSKKEIPYKKE